MDKKTITEQWNGLKPFWKLPRVCSKKKSVISTPWSLQYNVVLLQDSPILTVTAQTLLVKTPDEFSTKVAPREVGVIVGLEVVTVPGILGVALRRLDADAVPNQTHYLKVAWLTLVYRWGPTWSRCGQLDGVVNAEVLELDQLTFRHPVVDEDMSGLYSISCPDLNSHCQLDI